MAIRIGTSGFGYEDWREVLYPRELPKRRFLETYAREFDLVELNYTYYGMPEARTLAGLVRRTPDGFGFTLKLHGSMTHARNADEATYRAFLEALRPLVDGGRLLAVLGQFPQSLHPDHDARAHLERLRERLAGLPLVFEFRNRGWVRDEVRRWLRSLGVGYCCVDQPDLPRLVPPVLWVPAPPAYVRFHGRNAAKWYEHDDPAERYDYRYSTEELAEWRDRLRRLEAKAGTVLAFFNNHFRGNAVHDARALRGLLAAGD
ncbi:MAG: DUF72 domain-containing protein [Deltaproteobacteria bacterium]|nr:DUF72 domain-containing protein [Deltaproteobacteria bacterium]